MRQARWIALLVPALAGLIPQTAGAQVFAPQRRIAALMDQLREQMWVYRQELNFFQRAPEYEQLLELRYHLRNKAVRVAELGQAGPGTFPEQRELARGMEQTAREMFRLTRQLENRTDLGAREEVRRRADMLTDQVVEIRVLIGRWQEAVGSDFEDIRSRRPGGVVPPGRPFGRPGDGR
jgi:hypothetical protein